MAICSLIRFEWNINFDESNELLVLVSLEKHYVCYATKEDFAEILHHAFVQASARKVCLIDAAIIGLSSHRLSSRLCLFSKCAVKAQRRLEASECFTWVNGPTQYTVHLFTVKVFFLLCAQAGRSDIKPTLNRVGR
ncbi:unnamed protein product [Brugia pahangi]|uniref:Proteasome assembly chaperone 1 n=1 Tax=Brugia pahangi TaxID=6280 RepID=A0A0N4SX56_BRUPA|nr:unnamed protein product [Brugia pahangi]